MTSAASSAPYPSSKVIEKLTWDPDVVRLGGERAGDNWPMTWADDGLLYTSYGDGYGFSERSEVYSLGFATLSGSPPNHVGQDFLSDIDTPVGWGKDGIKASGLLMVEGVLYLFVRNCRIGEDWRHSRLACSSDRGQHWTWADWCFGDTFGCPEFVQFGPNYRGARDEYCYVVSQAGDSAYEFDADIVMARVPKGRLPEREAYEFYAGLGAGGDPIWSLNILQRQPILTDPRGTQRVAITYNRGLERYFLTSAHDDGSSAVHTAALGVFDASEPWGPWTTAYYRDRWADGWMIHHKFPTAWMSHDGKEMWLAFSGQYRPGGRDYCLLARKATVELIEP